MDNARLTQVLERIILLSGGRSREDTVNERFDATSRKRISGLLWAPLGDMGEMELGEVEVESIWGDDVTVTFPSLVASFYVVSDADPENQVTRLKIDKAERSWTAEQILEMLILQSEPNHRVKCDVCGDEFNSDYEPREYGDAESGPMGVDPAFCPKCLDKMEHI